MDLPERTADLLANGATKDVIAGRQFRALHRGVHVPAHVLDSPDLRIQAAARLLRPGDALGGWAAARLLGAPFLDGIGPAGPEDVLIHLPKGSKLRPRDGIRYLRTDAHDIVQVRGIAVTSPATTVVDLIRWAEEWREGAVAAECLLGTPLVRLEDVRHFLTAHPGTRGLPLVSRTLPLLSEHSWSPGETRLRFLWQLDAGLPRPLCNVRIHTAGGHLLGIADLLDPETGLVGEYDGRPDHERWSAAVQDRIREEAFEAVGLHVARFFNPDVTTRRRRRVHRLREAWRRGPAEGSWWAQLSDGRVVHPGDRVEPSASPRAQNTAQRSTRRP